VEQAFEFLRKENPEAAVAAAQAIRSAIDSLGTHPLLGRRIHGDIRELVISYGATGYIALYRFLLPGAQLRVCGGRPVVFGGDRQAVLLSGADGLMIGDYLTTPGEDPDLDRRAAQALNFRLEGPEEAA
jgi:plasmid stabilization system protein ParE